MVHVSLLQYNIRFALPLDLLPPFPIVVWCMLIAHMRPLCDRYDRASSSTFQNSGLEPILTSYKSHLYLSPFKLPLARPWCLSFCQACLALRSITTETMHSSRGFNLNEILEIDYFLKEDWRASCNHRWSHVCVNEHCHTWTWDAFITLPAPESRGTITIMGTTTYHPHHCTTTTMTIRMFVIYIHWKTIR